MRYLQYPESGTGISDDTYARGCLPYVVPHNASNRGPLSSRLLHNNNDNKRKTDPDQSRRPNEKEKEGKSAKKHLRRDPLPYMLIPAPIPSRPLFPQHSTPHTTRGLKNPPPTLPRPPSSFTSPCLSSFPLPLSQLALDIHSALCTFYGSGWGVET